VVMTTVQPSTSTSLTPRCGVSLQTYQLHDHLVHVCYYQVGRSELQEDFIAMANEVAELMQLHCLICRIFAPDSVIGQMNRLL